MTSFLELRHDISSHVGGGHERKHAEALALANAARLTVYDASYLWLARRLDVPLVTLDKMLARADVRR